MLLAIFTGVTTSSFPCWNWSDLRADDRVVAVGDLITKGPKSREVLELFRTDKRFRSVLGNHDLALLKYWRGEANSLKNSQVVTAAELESDSSCIVEFLGLYR